MNNPLYDINSTVYFRESAALGFIEALKITGVHLTSNGWVYSVTTKLSPPSPGAFQDRRTIVASKVLYFSESEFVDVCDAYALAEANARLNLEKIQLQRQNLCPSNPTSGTDND